MESLILYMLLTTSLYYLLIRAEVTRFLWKRYPKKLESFLFCAYCTGFWYGLVFSAFLGTYFELGFLGLPGDAPITWILVGLCSIVWTPILSDLHLSEILYNINEHIRGKNG